MGEVVIDGGMAGGGEEQLCQRWAGRRAKE